MRIEARLGWSFCSVVAVLSFAETPAEACTINGMPAPCDYLPIQLSVQCTLPPLPRPAPAGAPAASILHRVTLNEPDATCNDGTPAVFYVRRAPSGQNENKWLIVLEGGGTGLAPQGTLDEGMWNRWTGASGELLDCVQNGSTDFWNAAAGMPGRDGIVDLPAEGVFPGILDTRFSSFADYNLVFLNYCSSDSWAGAASAVELSGTWTVGADVFDGFIVDLNGHAIIEVVLDRLRNPLAWTPDEVQFHTRDIDDAELVLVAGESAGGTGVLYNLDWIAAQLPLATVLGSIGATHKPPVGTAADAWFVDVDADAISDLQEGAEVRLSQLALINGFIDESCLVALPAADEWQCTMLSSAEPHLTTPHFVKQDMSDPLISKIWTTADPVSGLSNFQSGIRSDYLAWRSAGAPPFFAPNCARHESLSSNRYYADTLQLYEFAVGIGTFGPVLDEVSYDEALRRFVDSGGTGTAFIYDGAIVAVPAPPPAFIELRKWVKSCP